MGSTIGTIVKPSVGISPEQTGDLVSGLVESGLDFVKDDELIANPLVRPGRTTRPSTGSTLHRRPPSGTPRNAGPNVGVLWETFSHPAAIVPGMATDVEPVDSELLDRLTRVSPAAIADTKHESVSVLAPAIEPIYAGEGFAGPARTVVIDPTACWPPVGTLDTAREDEVVVVDIDDSVEEAVWGELLSTYASKAGVSGVVTNGAVRDVDGIRDLGFPVFARALTPRGPSGTEEVDRNVPVTVGDAPIDPGDVVVADESGVVVIDRDAVEDVTAAAEAVAETERDVESLIHEGLSLERALEEAGMA